MDACASAAASFSDPNAMEGVAALDTAGDAVEALAASFKSVGSTIIDGVAIDPRIAPFIEELGDYIARTVPMIRDGAAAVRRVHADKIERIEGGDRRERAWDVSAHDGR